MKHQQQNIHTSLDTLTFLLPVRIDSPERLANLMAVLRFYSARTDAGFIVLEADDFSKASAAAEIGPRIRYEFVEDRNPVFHHTRINNMLLSMAETPYAAIWDVDAVAPPDQVEEALRLLAEEGHTLAYPYGGSYWCVGETFSEIFRRTLDISVLKDFPQSRYLLCGYHSVGGAVLVDVVRYAECGWDNEYFIGWGPEDAERFKRLEILDRTPGRTQGTLFHLHHPRGLNSGDFSEEVALSTKREYCRICSMDRERLRAEIEGWRWRP